MFINTPSYIRTFAVEDVKIIRLTISFSVSAKMRIGTYLLRHIRRPEFYILSSSTSWCFQDQNGATKFLTKTTMNWISSLPTFFCWTINLLTVICLHVLCLFGFTCVCVLLLDFCKYIITPVFWQALYNVKRILKVSINCHRKSVQ